MGDHINLPSKSTQPDISRDRESLLSANMGEPISSESKTFKEKMEELRTKYREELSNLFDEHVSGAKLPEMAFHEVKKIQGEQGEALKRIFSEYQQEHEKSAQNVSITRDNFRREVEESILKRAEQEANNRIQYIKSFFETVLQNTHIQKEEIVQFKVHMLSIEKITEQDQPLFELMKRLGEKKQLEAQDYAIVIDRLVNKLPNESLDPLQNSSLGSFSVENLQEKQPSSKERVEAGNVALVLAMMKPAERYTLIEQLMESEHKEHTAKIIDQMLQNGLLTQMQGEDLLFLALGRAGFSEEQKMEFENILNNIDQGSYSKKIEQRKQVLQQEAEKLDQMFAVNPIDRGLAGPFWGSLMKLHSVLWFTANLLYNHQDLGEDGGWARFATNPYVLASVAEFGIGHEIETGGKKIGVGWGSGKVSRWLESLGDDAPHTEEETRAYQNLSEMYSNYPVFGMFLEQGGTKTVMEVYEKRVENGIEDTVPLTVGEILENEQNPDRKAMLAEFNQNFPQATEKFINQIPQIYKVLEIENDQELLNKLAKIRKAQNIKGPYNPAPEPLFQ